VAGPVSRLAARLSLWFKQSNDLSRYGIPFAHDGTPVINLVRWLADKLDVKHCAINVRKGELRRNVARFQRPVLSARSDQFVGGRWRASTAAGGARLVSNSNLSASSLPCSGRPDFEIEARVS
jgi:hypothetical protein